MSASFYNTNKQIQNCNIHKSDASCFTCYFKHLDKTNILENRLYICRTRFAHFTLYALRIALESWFGLNFKLSCLGSGLKLNLGSSLSQ